MRPSSMSLALVLLTGCMHAGIPARTGRVPSSGTWRLGLNFTLPGAATGPGKHCPIQHHGQRPVRPPAAEDAQRRRPTPLVHRPPPQSEWAKTRRGCGVRGTARATYVVVMMMLPPTALLAMLDFEVGYTHGRTETIAHLGVNALGAEVRHAATESLDGALAVEGGVFWRPGQSIPHTRAGFTHSTGVHGGFTGGAHLSFGPEPHARMMGFGYEVMDAPLSLRLTGLLGGYGRPDGLELVGGVAPYIDFGIVSREFDVGGHPMLHMGTGELLN